MAVCWGCSFDRGGCLGAVVAAVPGVVSVEDFKRIYIVQRFVIRLAFEKRLGGVGFSPNRWQRILLSQAIVLPCLAALYLGGASDPYIAAGLFLTLQVPLILMKAKTPVPKPPEKPPSRRVRIALGSVFSLITAGGAAFPWRTHEPVWIKPYLILGSCYFAWSVYRLARQPRPRNTGPESENEAEIVEEPASKEFDPVVKKSANMLLICLGLAFVDLLFREELYGFILPVAWLVGSALWLAIFHTRRDEGLRPLTGPSGDAQ
jgi:hypothetical protein